MRIFPSSSSKSLYTSCWIIIVVLLAYLLSILLGLGLVCRPIQMLWDSSIPGTCGNATKLLEVATGLNIAFDIVLVLLPIASLLRLNVSMHAKLGIIIIFLTGQPPFPPDNPPHHRALINHQYRRLFHNGRVYNPPRLPLQSRAPNRRPLGFLRAPDHLELHRV
jgi:hypothetical protein